MAKKRTSGRRDNRTGSIYKDGNGYRVQILLRHDPDTGKAVFKKERTQTHDEAVEALARLQQSARTQYVAAPSGLTLSAFLTQWLANHVEPSRAPQTYRQYKWVLESHVIPRLGKMRLEHVTRPDIQKLVSNLTATDTKPKFKEQRKKDPKPDYPGKSGPKPKGKPKPERAPTKPLSRRTIQATVAVLHTAYESAIRDGLASINPVSYISLPPATNKPAAFLSPQQVIELNKKIANTPIQELIRFMLATGTRIGEATGIRWQDVDLDKGFVRISGQLQRIEKKLLYRPTTKTNQDRLLTISPWLVAELKGLKAEQTAKGYKDADGIVFLNPWGRRIDQRFVCTELAAACVRAEIPVVSPHKLRHTAATLALMETGDLHGVQKMLGHQQVALTSNLYGHATAERLRPIMDALGKVVNPTQSRSE